MTTHQASNDLYKNLLYLHPALYFSKSGSVYIFLPHGVIRVSEHDTNRKVRWKLFTNEYRVSGRHRYGYGEIGKMINDIKRELNRTEFAI